MPSNTGGNTHEAGRLRDSWRHAEQVEKRRLAQLHDALFEVQTQLVSLEPTERARVEAQSKGTCSEPHVCVRARVCVCVCRCLLMIGGLQIWRGRSRSIDMPFAMRSIIDCARSYALLSRRQSPSLQERRRSTSRYVAVCRCYDVIWELRPPVQEVTAIEEKIRKNKLKATVTVGCLVILSGRLMVVGCSVKAWNPSRKM